MVFDRTIWVEKVQNVLPQAGIRLSALVQIRGVIMSINSPPILNQHKHMNRHAPLKAMVVGPLILRKGQSGNLQK